VTRLIECEPDEEMCPGEDACELFLSAAQDSPNPLDNQKNRDMVCEQMGTRCSRRTEVDPSLKADVARVAHLVRLQRAGFSLEADRPSSVEIEGVVLWFEIEAAYERQHRKDMRELVGLMRGRAEAGL
jgi:hypothetical protein